MAVPDAPPSVLRRLRELTVVAVAALAALAALVTASEVHARADYDPERARVLLAQDGLAHLRAGLVDQETGVRGYLATGQEVFLEPYYSGQDEVLQGMAQLAAGPRDETALSLLADVERRAAVWQQEYGAPTLAAARRDRLAATDPGAAEAGKGKELFDAFRAGVDRLDRHLHARLGAVQEERERVRVGLLCGALGLLVLLAGVGGQRVRATRALVERPARALADRARAAAEARPTPDPGAVPAELVPVQDALDDLVADLASTRQRVAEQDVQLQRASRVTALLLEQTRLLAATTESPAVAAATGESALALLDGQRVAVWLDGPAGPRLAYASGSRPSPDDRTGPPVGTGSAAAERARHFGRVFLDDEAGVVAAPMIADGRTLGVVEVRLPVSGRPDGRDLDVLQVLLSQGAGALSAAGLLARTTELTLRDPLTGLANRRQLEHDLTDVDHHRDADVGLLVVDVDHFKRFNDRHGHAAGDDLLRALGDVLASVVRSGDRGDTVYRYGGEEFVVLLRDCQPHALVPSAERLRETVARRLIAHGVTVSVGAAVRGGASAKELFSAADGALYAAKTAGRNRVVLAEQPHAGLAARSATPRAA